MKLVSDAVPAQLHVLLTPFLKQKEKIKSIKEFALIAAPV